MEEGGQRKSVDTAAFIMRNTYMFIMFLPVYNSDVIDKQTDSVTSGDARDKAVIILVPVRLGGERTNTDYLEFVKVRSAFVFKTVVLLNIKTQRSLHLSSMSKS